MRTHFFIVCLEYRCGVKNERIRILHNVNQYDRTLARNPWRIPGKGAVVVMRILDIFVDFLDHTQSRGNSRVQVEHIGIYLMSVLLLDRFQVSHSVSEVSLDSSLPCTHEYMWVFSSLYQPIYLYSKNGI